MSTASDSIKDLEFSPDYLIHELQAAWCEHVEEVEKRAEHTEPQKNIYASQFHPCERNLYLQLQHSHELPPFNTDTLARFRRGKDRERDIKQDLSRIGRLCLPPFEVVKTQERFAITAQGREVISGKVDGRLKFDGMKVEPPFEVKSWAPHLVQHVTKFEDLLDNPWTRAGGMQLLCYQYGALSPYGFFILDRGGLPAILLAELNEANLDRLDLFIDLASRALAHKEQNLLAPPFTNDLSLCRKCKWFGWKCQPPRFSVEGTTVFAGDEWDEIAAKVARHEELKEGAHEYAGLHDDLNETFRGVELGVIGDYVINGKFSKNTTYKIPQEIKDQYKQTDPKGKFGVKFVFIGEE